MNKVENFHSIHNKLVILWCLRFMKKSNKYDGETNDFWKKDFFPFIPYTGNYLLNIF